MIELWGTSGGVDPSFYNKPLGGYVSGYLSLKTQKSFSILIGQRGQTGYNGQYRTCGGGGAGGKGYSYYSNGGSGGGATRLYYDSQQIMVAAGAGGFCGFRFGSSYIYGVPHAGGITAPRYGYTISGYYSGASQTYGVSTGVGQNGANGANYDCSAEGNGGGGAGYMGGYTTISWKDHENQNMFGSGGSSYISGHPSCKSHPEIKFENVTVKSGAESFFQPNGVFERGHYGDGFARISVIKYYIETLKVKQRADVAFLSQIMIQRCVLTF